MAPPYRDQKEFTGYYNFDRKELIKYIPEGAKRILDIGCGAGSFGELIKCRKSVEVWGVEKVAEVAHEARRKLDRVIVGNIESDDVELPLNYYDCVVFNDVIEHLVDPWSTLKRIKRHLVNKGTVIASIPNVRYWDNVKRLVLSKEWNYTEAGILDKGHLRFFTIKGIEKLFAQCGLELISVEGINRREFTWRFKLLNLLLNHFLDDTHFPQFACVARDI
jgi:2-polyprenyl-3-methyl-5-hydroxy-6-metoxy-1,4-benzoquinol methylase